MKKDTARFVIEVLDHGQKKWVRAVGTNTRQYHICWTKGAARVMPGGIAERSIAWLAPTAQIAGHVLKLVPA